MEKYKIEQNICLNKVEYIKGDVVELDGRDTAVKYLTRRGFLTFVEEVVEKEDLKSENLEEVNKVELPKLVSKESKMKKFKDKVLKKD